MSDVYEDEEERGFVETALSAADAGNAGHAAHHGEWESVRPRRRRSLIQWGGRGVSGPVECGGRCYSMTESGGGYIDPKCPKHGCTCPPHMDGVGREKWPDCPIHTLRSPVIP